jgi:hypothetical protein
MKKYFLHPVRDLARWRRTPGAAPRRLGGREARLGRRAAHWLSSAEPSVARSEATAGALWRPCFLFATLTSRVGGWSGGGRAGCAPKVSGSAGLEMGRTRRRRSAEGRGRRCEAAEALNPTAEREAGAVPPSRSARRSASRRATPRAHSKCAHTLWWWWLTRVRCLARGLFYTLSASLVFIYRFVCTCDEAKFYLSLNFNLIFIIVWILDIGLGNWDDGLSTNLKNVKCARIIKLSLRTPA